jgi:predicted nucleic acid-binding protein
MTSLAVVDAPPLYAAADADDEDHLACRAALSRADLRLIVPALAVAEAAYFVGRRLGAAAESKFLKRRRQARCRGSESRGLRTNAGTRREVRRLPLGGTDASVIALAERLDAPIILILDRRHFAEPLRLNPGSGSQCGFCSASARVDRRGRQGALPCGAGHPAGSSLAADLARGVGGEAVALGAGFEACQVGAPVAGAAAHELVWLAPARVLEQQRGGAVGGRPQ